MRKGIQVKRVCKICGKIFYKKSCLVMRGWGKYCSPVCQGVSYQKRITRVCKVCKKSFNALVCRIENGGGIFCSVSCRQKDWTPPLNSGFRKGHKHSVEVINKITKKLTGRKQSVETKTKRGESLKKAWKNRLDYKGLIERTCQVCNKLFRVPHYVVDKGIGKYCSNKCNYISKNSSGKNHPNWLGGLSFEPYGIEFNNKLKQQIRDRDKHTCQECGFNEEKLDRKLSIHHIDYNKKNNNQNNLISLCRSCHMQTNFKREDWTNYFQGRVL